MKRWISLLGGLIIGILLSYFTLDYKGLTLEYIDEKGNITKKINELDFGLITNSVLIVLGISILIYGIWTLIEKKSKDL